MGNARPFEKIIADFVQLAYFRLRRNMLCFKHLKCMRGFEFMTRHTGYFAYRYFSFTYFAGKAYSGLAESTRV